MNKFKFLFFFIFFYNHFLISCESSLNYILGAFGITLTIFASIYVGNLIEKNNYDKKLKLKMIEISKSDMTPEGKKYILSFLNNFNK